MENLEKKVVVQSNIGQRIIGVFVFSAALCFLYVANTMIGPTGDADFDRTRQGIQLFQSLIALAVASGGAFMAFSRREMIYDEKTVTIKTTIFGKSFSRTVDRELVKDLGLSAFGIGYGNRRHNRF